VSSTNDLFIDGQGVIVTVVAYCGEALKEREGCAASIRIQPSRKESISEKAAKDCLYSLGK
jgi:hypothetical protein